jgi:hypothetical protein
MAKTYNTFTDVATGEVLTATNFNNVLENVGNYRVPPACIARRTSNITSYSSGTAIAWESVLVDTESPSDPMWASGANASRITIRTAGLYQVSFIGYLSCTATASVAQARVLLNGAASPILDAGLLAFNGGQAATWYLSGMVSLAATDYLEAAVAISGGSAYIINGSATSQNFAQTRLCVAWLGQAS